VNSRERRLLVKSYRNENDSKTHQERRITPSPKDLLVGELLVWKPSRLNTVDGSDDENDHSE
jgi:hypothetical protein